MSEQLTQTELITSFVDRLNADNPEIETAVVLIGSVARKAATSRSDLDLLLVSEDRIKVSRPANRLHVQVLTREEFLNKLLDGDDFAAWCIRYGIPVQRAAVWDDLIRSEAAKTWPLWNQKVEHAARRLLLASDLLATGDLEAAAEELAYAVSHTGRGLLLRKTIFPLSRPEMIDQLTNTEYPELGLILEKLSFGRADEALMKQTIRYVKKLLVHLDRGRYEEYILARREAHNSKTAKRAKWLASNNGLEGTGNRSATPLPRR